MIVDLKTMVPTKYVGTEDGAKPMVVERHCTTICYDLDAYVPSASQELVGNLASPTKLAPWVEHNYVKRSVAKTHKNNLLRPVA